MSPEAASHIRQTWVAIVPRADTVADDFYARLFEIDPEARAKFAHVDMASQRVKFMQMLQAMVKVLDDPGLLVSHSAASGRRHAGYGATRLDYELAGSALMQALATALGERWTPPVRDAWRELYALLSSVMQRAGGRPSTAVQER